MKFASSVAWAVMENHGFNAVKDLSSHQRLTQKGAVFTNYFSTTHPSGPNYRTLACGEPVVPTEEFRGTHIPNIASWVNTTVFHLTDDDIAWRHDPYLDLGAAIGVLHAKKVDQPLCTIIDKLRWGNHLYFGWSDSSNGHSGSLEVADANLNELLDSLDKSEWFNTSVGGLYPVFMFAWDEDLQDPGRNQVFCAMYGRGVKPGLYPARHDHYDFNRTMTDIYELQSMGHGKTAIPMTEPF